MVRTVEWRCVRLPGVGRGVGLARSVARDPRHTCTTISPERRERRFQVDSTDVQAGVGGHVDDSPGECRISDPVSVGGLALAAKDRFIHDPPLDFLRGKQIRSQLGDVRGLVAKAADLGAETERVRSRVFVSRVFTVRGEARRLVAEIVIEIHRQPFPPFASPGHDPVEFIVVQRLVVVRLAHRASFLLRIR